jgi:hypothetical protein
MLAWAVILGQLAMAWFLNFYRCARCKRIWTDQLSCMCDDDWRNTRGGNVYAGWQISLRHQLHRPGCFHSKGRRDEGHQYRQTFQGAWAPGIGPNESALERDDFSSNRHPALSFCLSMIFSENRYPLFRIMLRGRREKTRLAQGPGG